MGWSADRAWKITVSGIPNYLIYCNIFIVRTKVTNVDAGRGLETYDIKYYDSSVHKKIHLQSKRISSIHLIGDWLGVSKNRKFHQNPTLLQQPVSQHVKGIFWSRWQHYSVRSEKFPQTLLGILKTALGEFEAVNKTKVPYIFRVR